MTICEGTVLRFVEKYQFGRITLAMVEINPRSGPPEFVVLAPTPEGAWLENTPAEKDWMPDPHQETVFGLFLLTPRRDILLSNVCGNPAQVECDAEWLRTALQPLTSLEDRYADRWDTVGIECTDPDHDFDNKEESDEPK
jgi:hypothetical protein